MKLYVQSILNGGTFKVTFPSKAMTMVEVTHHIALVTNIPQNEQVLLYLDGRVFYHPQNHDCCNLVPRKFFDLPGLIVHTIDDYDENVRGREDQYKQSARQYIKVMNSSFPKTSSDDKDDKDKSENDSGIHHPKWACKYSKRKLSLYQRFVMWPYLKNEILYELNSSFKSNCVNYNPQLLYYWENTAYIAPRVINNQIVLIIPMTKQQVFSQLKKNDFVYYRSFRDYPNTYKFNLKYDYNPHYNRNQNLPTRTVLSNDANMEFKDAIVDLRDKHNNKEEIAFRTIGYGFNDMKIQKHTDDEWSMSKKSAPFAHWFDFGAIFKPSATAATVQEGLFYSLIHGNININKDQSIPKSNFLYARDMVVRALIDSELVMTSISNRFECSTSAIYWCR